MDISEVEEDSNLSLVGVEELLEQQQKLISSIQKSARNKPILLRPPLSNDWQNPERIISSENKHPIYNDPEMV